MKQRKIGSISVGEIGFGCMGITSQYGVPDEKGGIEAIHRAMDLGVTLFDTAEGYGVGENETILGKAIKGRRDKVVISTKFSSRRRPSDPENKLSQAAYAPIACEASLKRLGTDVIDVWFIHRVNKGEKIEETIGAMKRLVEAGKVREIGLSEPAVETIRRAHKVHPLASLQNEFSLWTRDVEKEVLPVCNELGIGLMPYSPLGRGFFTGRVTTIENLPDSDLRKTAPRFLGENFDRNKELLAVVEGVAKEAGCLPGQVALAWLLAKAPHVVPIPGTKRRQYVEENSHAGDFKLTPAQVKTLDDAFSPEAIAGARYADHLMTRIGG